MKAVNSYVLAEIYTQVLLMQGNGFCRARGTFLLEAINTVRNGGCKLPGGSQIGQLLCVHINQAALSPRRGSPGAVNLPGALVRPLAGAVPAPAAKCPLTWAGGWRPVERGRGEPSPLTAALLLLGSGSFSLPSPIVIYSGPRCCMAAPASLRCGEGSRRLGSHGCAGLTEEGVVLSSGAGPRPT